MRESFKDKLARQIALEDESRALGASRYRARRPLPWRHEPSSTDEEGDLPPGRQLLRLAIQPTAEAIRSFCDVVNHGGGTRIPEAALILSSVGAEEAAYLTGRVILSAAAEGKKLTATAIAVADAIIEHQQMENLRRARADVFKGVLRVQAHGVRSLKMKRKIQNIMSDHGFDQPFPLAMRIRTGVKAIELFCDATGLFAIESQGQRTKYVRPTEAVHKWLEQQHARCELLEPISLPMIVRPRRWSSPFKGGYITKQPGNRLVKQANAAYHDQLRDQMMPGVYDAVNAVQETAWKINAPILAIMREIWDGGGELGDLPARNSDVAAAVQARVNESYDPAATAWKGNKVTRKITKRPVMTFTYSATKYGYCDQILQTLREIDGAGQPYLDADNYVAARYMAAEIWDGVQGTVVAAAEAMAWLRTVASIMTKAGVPIRWTAPTGLPVLQTYKSRKADLIRVVYKGQRIRLQVRNELSKLDSKRQANGISPNLIHSMDASHLMGVANRCYDHDIRSLAVVHDSFGVHAARVSDLQNILRDTFADLYETNWLEVFREEFIAQLPPEWADKIPPVPALGAFDIEQVRRSPYLFA
ncbi:MULTISPECIES: DNA-directed RNA polymerase [Brevundimonas]|uniref:DNA-directed RNA polymerase n=1 Tax=Brevundimonas TaxID=41275 RepID=UPI0025BD136F|nr:MULTISPECIES: DNA-directed RNA polymerase [Brevundimonas]